MHNVIMSEVKTKKKMKVEDKNNRALEWNYACMSCLVHISGEERRAASAALLLLVVFVFDIEVFGMSVKTISCGPRLDRTFHEDSPEQILDVLHLVVLLAHLLKVLVLL